MDGQSISIFLVHFVYTLSVTCWWNKDINKLANIVYVFLMRTDFFGKQHYCKMHACYTFLYKIQNIINFMLI